MDYQIAAELRKQEFENTLLDLMQTMPYSSISITDITSRMQLVRKTFYHYFPNKQACLESLTDRVLTDCNMYVLKTLPPHYSAFDISCAQLRFWIAHKPFLDALIKNELASFFAGRALRFSTQEGPSVLIPCITQSCPVDPDHLFFYITGQVFLLLKWCAENFPLSAEEMAKKCIRLAHEPLIPEENRIP